MIDDFNAEQARAHSSVGTQLTFDQLLIDLLNCAKTMSFDNFNFAAKDYLTEQLDQSLVDDVLAELEKRDFKVETCHIEDTRKIRFKISW